MKKVIMIERVLTHYRAPFFNLARNVLEKRNIDFLLIHGQGNQKDLIKKDTAELSWATKIQNTYLPFGFVWQPYLKFIKTADLIIIEQANRLLANYLMLMRLNRPLQKIAFWGHGRNFQANSKSLWNKVKRLYSTKSDWWFCYTESGKKHIRTFGFPESQITVLQNAIDTSALSRQSNSLNKADLVELKIREGIGNGPIAIYCGGIYKEKRINFLLQACKKIRAQLPSFELIVLGSGVDVPKILVEVSLNKWIHYVGPQFGKNKAAFFKIADIFLMPGLVGLGIMDSFALQIPLITTEYPFHSPEIEYLKNGENGVITGNSIEEFVEGVIQLICDKDKIRSIKENCKKSSMEYTIEKMVENFTNGIINCLNSK